MTVDELLARESIRDTLARYNIAGDRLKTDEFIHVFTEDAIYDLGSEQLVGRPAILNWFAGWGRKPGDGHTPGAEASEAPRVKFVRHNLTTCLINLTGSDSAEARTYYVVYTDIGPDHSGYYVDRFRPVDGRWLIAHRKVRCDWTSPASIFVSQRG